jgi:hypothetical protein
MTPKQQGITPFNRQVNTGPDWQQNFCGDMPIGQIGQYRNFDLPS